MKSGCEDRKATNQGLIQLPRPQAFSARSGIRKSKTSRWRAAALILLNLLMIAHIIQWRITGKTVSPIEPSETMHTLQRGAINAGFIFFSLAILATLIFGRFVCGWGCHILALQDFCGWMLKKMGLTPKPFRSRLLIYVPLIAALYMFVWPTAYRFFASPEPGPLIPKFTNHLVTEEFLGNFSFRRGRHSLSFHLRIPDRLFPGAKGFLHLRLSLRRIFWSRRQAVARENPGDRRLQSMRPLHGHLHFERSRPRGGEGHTRWWSIQAA